MQAGELELADVLWYEVKRVGDVQGNLSRTLFFGSLDGSVRGEVPLGSQSPDERQGGREAYVWTDPQADGIFGDHVIVWGRDHRASTLESINLEDGSVATIAEASATIHVATANASFTRAFYIAVDEATNQPTGLWSAGVVDDRMPEAIQYEFAGTPVDNSFTYRLASNRDGSIVAIQAGLGGPATLIEVDSGQSTEIAPRGTILGFVDDYLITVGPLNESGSASLVAFQGPSWNGHALAEQVSAAQLPSAAGPALVAFMRAGTGGSRTFDVAAVDVETGAVHTAYVQDPSELGPVLVSKETRQLAAGLPVGWTLLADSFIPFIGEPQSGIPEERYPKVLNLVTGETVRLGPFVVRAEP